MKGAGYRFFFLDPAGHVRRRLELECDNDDDALNRARELNHAHGIEVWSGARKVGVTDPGSGG